MRNMKEIAGKSLAGTKETLNTLTKTIKEQVCILLFILSCFRCKFVNVSLLKGCSCEKSRR